MNPDSILMLVLFYYLCAFIFKPVYAFIKRNIKFILQIECFLLQYVVCMVCDQPAAIKIYRIAT